MYCKHSIAYLPFWYLRMSANYLEFYWHCLSGVLCIWELFSNRILVYVSGRPETPQGDQRSLKAMQGECRHFWRYQRNVCLWLNELFRWVVRNVWESFFGFSWYDRLFGINRTHDRPAETFVYVVFHSLRIMYVNLITVYANFAQEARWGAIRCF